MESPGLPCVDDGRLGKQPAGRQARPPPYVLLFLDDT